MRHRFARTSLILALVFLLSAILLLAQSNATPDRQQVLAAMKRATMAMDKLSTNGGYVWLYLPDLSRRWGEMEARDTMIWIQPPGTPTLLRLQPEKYDRTLKCFSPY